MKRSRTTAGSKSKDVAKLLYDAIHRDQSDVVRRLLRAGASASTRDECGNAVLFTAAFVGKATIAKLLIEAGADVLARSHSDNTALHPAAWGGHKDVAELLIANGADANAQNNSGETPLICAAEHGHTDIVRCLIEAGADAEVKNSKGLTALAVALKERHAATVGILDAARRQREKTEGHADPTLHEFKRTIEILNRLGRQLFFIETKRADDDPSGEKDFFRALFCIAERGHSSSVLATIYKECGLRIPSGLAKLHRKGLVILELFNMFYDSDFPGGTCAGRFVALYSKPLRCGVCINDAFEAGVIELIDAFECRDESFPPATTIHAALAHLGKTRPPDEFTNLLDNKLCPDALIIEAVRHGEWASEYSDDESARYLKNFLANFAMNQKGKRGRAGK